MNNLSQDDWSLPGQVGTPRCQARACPRGGGRRDVFVDPFEIFFGSFRSLFGDIGSWFDGWF